jgi:oligopeptide/dipeptide ABC transporter ATP-binding protein
MLSIPPLVVTEPVAEGRLAADAVPGAGALLEISGLTLGIRRRHETLTLVRDVNLTVNPGERVGIVGESGSGKSLTMLAVMGLLPRPVELLSGSIRLAGQELAGASEDTLRRVRGSDAAMVYQDPMTSLDPMLRIGSQVAEGPRAHGVKGAPIQAKVRTALAEAGFPNPERIERMYPHELSGGMRQRAMIASALIGSPRLLIADEPTTALDVTIQRQILRLIFRLQRQHHMAVVWITHDLGVVAQFAQRVAVMYAGRVVELAPTRRLFKHPEHPYSAALLGALPSAASAGSRHLPQIPGMPPDPGRLPSGCSFHPRCQQAIDRCARQRPPMTERAGSSAAECWVPPAAWTPRESR